MMMNKSDILIPRASQVISLCHDNDDENKVAAIVIYPTGAPKSSALLSLPMQLAELSKMRIQRRGSLLNISRSSSQCENFGIDMIQF